MELIVIVGLFVALAVFAALGLTADSRVYPRFANPADNPHLSPWVE